MPIHMTISRLSCPKIAASYAVCGEYVTAIPARSTKLEYFRTDWIDAPTERDFRF